jgi:predicted PolB exonuclease-like 3'-5' exonuclease
MAKKIPVRYLVFDCESAVDGQLVADVRYPGEDLDPVAAVDRYRAELLEKTDSEFIPYTFQVPVSVAIGKVSADFQLLEVVTLDEPHYRPHVITEHFWRGWTAYDKPTLVSFNGRSFDLPLLELAAFRFGISVPDWFSTKLKSWDQYRNRYNQNAHLDLQELLTNFGASRLNGGLNLVANLLGQPGKMGVAGYMVQDTAAAMCSIPTLRFFAVPLCRASCRSTANRNWSAKRANGWRKRPKPARPTKATSSAGANGTTRGRNPKPAAPKNELPSPPHLPPPFTRSARPLYLRRSVHFADKKRLPPISRICTD